MNVAIFAIAIVAALELAALAQHVDGIGLAAAMGAIGAIAGYTARAATVR